MPIAAWLVASSSSEDLINADRFLLGRTGLTSGKRGCLLATAVEARIVWLSIGLPRGFAL
jgi:hypothetical protein